ncbi:DsbA family protein [Vibrio sinaloensis]|uniref:DsbA family protein n=1 Tax=Photobacterium sp. (strain ATCC 43367) TaxID=379097 RepID=UPI00057F9DCE|nr:DsbA family protein [Vibrio sinaloensis]KHT46417.1 thioredoxin [Vibrio sinaloensis]
MTKAKLYYVYDPMCSWCWGYKPTWRAVEDALKGKVDIQYLVGGLAADSDQPMPQEMRQQIASYWKKIETLLGTEFNYDFWTSNTPRRSTYPSCRAAIAARKQGKEKEMVDGIQKAYYLQARNPSDDSVLFDVARELGLAMREFEHDYYSNRLEEELQDELRFARGIGGNHFPSLFLQTQEGLLELPIDYHSPESTLSQIQALIK